MQPADNRIKIQVLVVPINTDASPTKESVNWEGKSITVKTYSKGWGSVMMHLFKKATLVNIEQKDGTTRETYVNKRSLGKRMLMAQGAQEADITDKDKDTAYELLFSSKPISKISQSKILCIPSTLSEQVQTMLKAKEDAKKHEGKEDAGSFQTSYNKVHDDYVSQNQDIATTHLKNSLKSINESLSSAKEKFDELKSERFSTPANSPFRHIISREVFAGLLTDHLDTLEWKELSPSVEMELETFATWLHELHLQLDQLANEKASKQASYYQNISKLTQFVKTRPNTPWLDTIEFLHLPPEETRPPSEEILDSLNIAAKQGNTKAQLKLDQLDEKNNELP